MKVTLNCLFKIVLPWLSNPDATPACRGCVWHLSTSGQTISGPEGGGRGVGGEGRESKGVNSPQEAADLSEVLGWKG